MLRRHLSLHAWLLVLVMVAFPVLACSFSFDLAGDATPTAAPQPTLLPSTLAPQPSPQSKPTSSVKASGIIKTVTMALDVKGDNKEPINPTILFSSNSVFHAVVTIENAPANTQLKATWYATDVGSAADPNTLIDSFELSSDGSRNLDFTLAPKAAWPVGTYRVEIAVNGNVERVVDFSVGAAPSTPTAVPPKPSGYISSVTMAQGTKGDNKDPVNPGTVFQNKSVFHAVVAIKNAPKNSKVTATWYAVDIGSGGEPNTVIDSADLTTDGTRNIDFTLNPSNTWPVGTYRVDVLFNGVLDQSATFTVK
jgi:hypothetical protein